MTLYEKIISIYPSLAPTTDANGKHISDFETYIILQNDSDGKGDYIKFWGHPSLPQPTQEQLDAI